MQVLYRFALPDKNQEVGWAALGCLASQRKGRDASPPAGAGARAHPALVPPPPPPRQVGLPVASCLLVRAPIGSEKPDGSRAFVIRPYTPISHPDERGHFDLAIKVYKDGK